MIKKVLGRIWSGSIYGGGIYGSSHRQFIHELMNPAPCHIQMLNCRSLATSSPFSSCFPSRKGNSLDAANYLIRRHLSVFYFLFCFILQGWSFSFRVILFVNNSVCDRDHFNNLVFPSSTLCSPGRTSKIGYLCNIQKEKKKKKKK